MMLKVFLTCIVTLVSSMLTFGVAEKCEWEGVSRGASLVGLVSVVVGIFSAIGMIWEM